MMKYMIMPITRRRVKPRRDVVIPVTIHGHGIETVVPQVVEVAVVVVGMTEGLLEVLDRVLEVIIVATVEVLKRAVVVVVITAVVEIVSLSVVVFEAV